GFIRCPRLDPALGAGNGAVPTSLTTLVACNRNNLAFNQFLGALIGRDNRIVSQGEFDQAVSLGQPGPAGIPFGFYPVYLRGDAQINAAVRLNQSLFAKFNDIRTSMGAEIRVQVPVLNVPFRLIYAYNPNARQDQIIQGQLIQFFEKR